MPHNGNPIRLNLGPPRYVLPPKTKSSNVTATIARVMRDHQYRDHPAVVDLDIPHISSTAFNALREDIRKNGLKDKLIKDDQNRVIDGRARLVAMLLEGKKPTADQWQIVTDKSMDAVKVLLVQRNLNRKHLTTGQMAMIVAQHQSSGTPMVKEALKLLSTSQETLARASRVLKSGMPDVIEQVRSGRMAVSKADKIISGRVPDDGTEAPHRVAAPDKNTRQASSEVADDTSKESKPKNKRGRPQGNASVTTWKSGWTTLSKTKDHSTDIIQLWKPTRIELKRVENQLKQCLVVVESVKKRRFPN